MFTPRGPKTRHNSKKVPALRLLLSQWLHNYFRGWTASIAHNNDKRKRGTIATQYSKKHLQLFLETHGEKSRIVICVFCEKFGGVKLEGEAMTVVYHQPGLKPFCNKRISAAICSDSRIQKLQNDWWYSTGDTQAECENFEYGDSYKWIYKDVTGWSEYP
jgi:hypothetical protein